MLRIINMICLDNEELATYFLILFSTLCLFCIPLYFKESTGNYSSSS